MFNLKSVAILISVFEFAKLQENNFEPYYDWKYVNFTWPSYEEYQEAVETGRYAVLNNTFTGVKHYEDRIFLSLPRSKEGTPVTLAYVLKSSFNKSDQLLTPYPSWEMNVQDDCESLQNVQSMEVDRNGIMWVIDGRRRGQGEPDSHGCPPKIVLLDLNNNGEVVQSYTVPNDTCYYSGCFLNDIVIDEIEGGFAYISEASQDDPGIIVYSRAENRAWKVRDAATMWAEENAANFEVHGLPFTALISIDGIALSQPLIPDDPEKTVYYCPLTGYYLYAISAEVLRDETVATGDVSSYIRTVGSKPAQTDGMVVDSAGNLYYGLVPFDGIARWNTSGTAAIEDSDVIELDSELINWPDTFGYDNDDRHLLVSSVTLNTFSVEGYDPEVINLRILRLFTNERNYLYGAFDTYPGLQ